MNLFLVPASQENIHTTILNSVDISVAKEFLSLSEFSRLQRVLGSEKQFHCWAMTEKRSSYFWTMQPGDVVLLTLKGSELFEYMCEVFHKMKSERLGKHLWPYTPRGPWTLIYCLRNIEKINVDKDSLVSALGFSSKYKVPGIIHVERNRLGKVFKKYGSVQQFLEAVRKERFV